MAYTQNFDSLPRIGTNLSTITFDWVFREIGPFADNLFAAGNYGTPSSDDTYSFGSSSSDRDRAFGGIPGYGVRTVHGSSFLNQTGIGTIDVTISYTGEQWRLGGTNGTKLDFQYSLNATNLTNGIWIDCDALDFDAPVSSQAPTEFGPLDGNLSSNRTELSGVISSLPLGVGEAFWIRWIFNSDGDHGLAVDDFSIVAVPEPSVGLLSVFGVLLISKRKRS